MRRLLRDALFKLADRLDPDDQDEELDQLIQQLAGPTMRESVGETMISMYMLQGGPRVLLVTQHGATRDMIGPMRGACEGILSHL